MVSIATFFRVGYINKNEKLLSIPGRTLLYHIGVTIFVSILTMSLTGGYVQTCNGLSDEVKYVPYNAQIS